MWDVCWSKCWDLNNAWGLLYLETFRGSRQYLNVKMIRDTNLTTCWFQLIYLINIGQLLSGKVEVECILFQFWWMNFLFNGFAFQGNLIFNQTYQRQINWEERKIERKKERYQSIKQLNKQVKKATKKEETNKGGNETIKYTSKERNKERKNQREEQKERYKQTKKKETLLYLADNWWPLTIFCNECSFNNSDIFFSAFSELRSMHRQFSIHSRVNLRLDIQNN